MDPRKTVRIADFDRVLRESRPIIIARRVIAVGTPERAASLTQTLVWGRGDDAKSQRESSPFAGRTTLNDLKAASALSLADELEARVNELSRPRARVGLENQEVQRLAAEVWASQPSIGLQTMASTWRDQSLDRSTVPQPLPSASDDLAEPALSAPPALGSELLLPSRLSTDALSPIGRIFRRLQLQHPNLAQSEIRPRRLQLPNLRARRGLRIACGALCAFCLAITWMSISGKLDARSASAPAAKPAPAQKAVAKAGPTSAAPSGQAPDDVPTPALETVQKPEPIVRAAPAPQLPSSVTPRSAVDALMAGKHEIAMKRYRALAQSSPSNPAYEAAARILAETEQPDPEDL